MESKDTYTREELQQLFDTVALNVCALLVGNSGTEVNPALVKVVSHEFTKYRPE